MLAEELGLVGILILALPAPYFARLVVHAAGAAVWSRDGWRINVIFVYVFNEIFGMVRRPILPVVAAPDVKCRGSRADCCSGGVRRFGGRSTHENVVESV